MFPTKCASIFRRFVAFLVDTVITGLIPLISFFNLRFMNHGKFLEFLDRLLIRWPGVEDPVVSDFIWMFILFILINIIYYTVLEAGRRQATPGKMMMGIFVTDYNGNRISYLRALGRSLGRILSMIICFVGYVMALLNLRNQALHDLLAGTLVLEADYASARAGETPAAETEASIEDDSSPAE